MKLQAQQEAEAIKAQHAREIELAKLQAADTLNLRDNQVKLTIAGASQEQKAEKEAEKEGAKKDKEAVNTSLATLQKGLADLHKAVTSPKTVIRGPDGRVSGIKHG
jgi:hypothetical protein